MKIIAGVYQIINAINGKSYIGSSKNVIKRWYRHRQQLKKGNHHSVYLQRAWNKYGSNSFTLKILIETNDLFVQEQLFINQLKPEYNVGAVGGGDNITLHPDLNRIKEKHRKNYFTNEIGLRNQPKQHFGESNPNWKGGISKFKCIDCNSKISYGHQRCTICSKLGNQNPFFGKQHSEETKEKLRRNKLGIKPINSKSIIINNIEYKSQSDAAKALGISSSLMTYRIKKGFYK